MLPTLPQGRHQIEMFRFAVRAAQLNETGNVWTQWQRLNRCFQKYFLSGRLDFRYWFLYPLVQFSSVAIVANVARVQQSITSPIVNMTTSRFVTEKKRCRETLPSLPQGGFRSPVFKHKPNITISCFKNLNRRKCSRFPARLYPKVKHYDSFFQTLNRRKISRFPARLYPKAKHYDFFLFQKLIK